MDENRGSLMPDALRSNAAHVDCGTQRVRCGGSLISQLVW